MTYKCTEKITWIIDLFDDSVRSYAPNEIVRIELALHVMRLQLGSSKNAPSLFSFLEETILNVYVCVCAAFARSQTNTDGLSLQSLYSMHAKFVRKECFCDVQRK